MEPKVIKKTSSSYIGVPRLDFISPDFDAFVDNKGYDVVWERAIPCPCSKRVQHQSTCQNCAGTGWVFINPVQIKAVITSINKTTKYKEWSTELLGTMAVTMKSVYHLNFMDRLTVLNSDSLQSEILLIKKISTTLFVRTIYSITSIVDIFKYESVSSTLKLLKKTEDYIFEGNRITFLKSVVEGDSVSITYSHQLQYHVLDLPHDVRNTITLDNKGREQDLNLPISAIARKTDKVISSYEFIGDTLFNNSY